jgi:AcrR family transcriptional regulator
MNYHFGDRAALIDALFAKAESQRDQWDARWRSMPPAVVPLEALPGWLATVGAEQAWSIDYPGVLLRELAMDAGREARRQPIAQRVRSAIDLFWRDSARHLGCAPVDGVILADFIDGLTGLHAGNRALSRLAWMSETCRRFVARLFETNAATGWDGWRLRERRWAAAPSEPAFNSRETEVLDAAVGVLGSGGLAALTHRAVAARAATSLAAVTNAHPTRELLVRATFDRLVAQLAEGRRPTLTDERLDARDLARRTADSLILEDGAVRPQILAAEELMAHSARDMELAPLAAGLRAARGENSALLLQNLITRHDRLDSLDAHLVSLMMTGAIRAAYAEPPETRRSWLATRLTVSLERLYGVEAKVG